MLSSPEDKTQGKGHWESLQRPNITTTEFPLSMHNLNLIMREHNEGDLRMRDSHKTVSAFHNVSVMKDKERLRNCPRLKDTQGSD